MKPLHKATIGPNMWCTVRQRGNEYTVQYEHATLGEGKKQLSSHKLLSDAIHAADTEAIKAASIIPQAIDRLGVKLNAEGFDLSGIGPELALELVEQGKVSL